MEPSLPKEMTPDLAEICGIHAGDGYMRCRNGNHFELDISGNIDEKEYYDSHVVPLFEKTFGIKIKAQFFQPRNTYGFRIGTREICETLHALGFPYGKKTLTVEVPKKVLESRDLDVIYSFLRGVFDTDGTISFRVRKGSGYSEFHRKRNTLPTIQLGVCSKRLRDGVGLLLLKTGFQFGMSFQRKRKGWNKAYTLVLQGDQTLLSWINNIGFKNKCKNNRILIWEKFGFNPPNLELKDQEDILSGRVNPNSFYSEPCINSEKTKSKILSIRMAQREVLESLIPKG